MDKKTFAPSNFLLPRMLLRNGIYIPETEETVSGTSKLGLITVSSLEEVGL